METPQERFQREISQRDELHNAIYRAIKEHGAGMQIARVRDVLNVVISEIVTQSGMEPIDALFDKEYFSERTDGK